MWGYRPAKNVLKYAAGCSSAASALLKGSFPGSRACIFDYHRVAFTSSRYSGIDNWNVTPDRFERHAQWLARETECVPLERLLERVRSGRGTKPLVALSFDDGYANFRLHVLPVLQRHSLPATVSVVTRYLDSAAPFPFDSWGLKVATRAEEKAWRPISWRELEECVASGLVSVGSHSHSHFCGSDCEIAELEEEAIISRDIIQRRLGAHQGRVFAYPYGCSCLGQVPPAYVTAVKQAGYLMALTTDLGLLDQGTSRFLLPRIEAHGWDSPAILRGKANGCLGAFRLLQGLRKRRRSKKPVIPYA